MVQSSFCGKVGTMLPLPDTKLSLLLIRFATAAKAHHEALEAMDENGANAHARVIAGLNAALLRAGQAGRDALLGLIDADTPVVAGMAAVYAIRFDPARCLAALRRVATEPGLLGFRASVAIQRWESGQWQDPA